MARRLIEGEHAGLSARRIIPDRTNRNSNRRGCEYLAENPLFVIGQQNFYGIGVLMRARCRRHVNLNRAVPGGPVALPDRGWRRRLALESELLFGKDGHRGGLPEQVAIDLAQLSGHPRVHLTGQAATSE